MMKHLLSMLLVLCLTFGMALPASADPGALSIEEIFDFEDTLKEMALQSELLRSVLSLRTLAPCVNLDCAVPQQTMCLEWFLPTR